MHETNRQMQQNSETGGIKLAVHRLALKARNEYPGLFTTGKYVPLQTGGSKAAHIFAFARSHAVHIAIIAIPRLFSGLIGKPGRWPCGPDIWGDTHITLPEFARDREFRNIFTDHRIKPPERSQPLRWLAADIFAECPVALFIS